MKLEVRSRTQESVDQIVGQARQIPDHVQRLRYLKEAVTLVPETPRWQRWLQLVRDRLVWEQLRR